MGIPLFYVQKENILKGLVDEFVSEPGLPKGTRRGKCDRNDRSPAFK
jgi:hypothetical protein